MLNASDLFPQDTSQFPIPDRLFRQVSKRLRTAEYDDPFLFKKALPALQKFSRDLYADAQARRKSFTEREAVYYLWSLCLQAELHDYAGETEKAHEALEKVGKELEDELDDGMLGHSSTRRFSLRLLRQQLWTLVFWSHCHYRDEKRPEHLIAARSLLKKIRRQIKHKLLSGTDERLSEPSYGLRARVAYSLGQVNRQLSEVKAAREEFMAAIEFTRKRLEDKTRKYKGRRLDLLREQEYAKYVIAKTFSFGLAWASYNSGELRRARGSAAGGCALLETMHDPVHKAYAQVVYAGVLSATSRPVKSGESAPDELAEAVRMLRPLADEHTSPLKGVSRLFARARFTLAGALFAAGDHDEAREWAQRIYQFERPGSRWHIESGVLLTRLLLEKPGHFAEAREQSRELMRLISEQPNLPPEVRIAVILCSVDVKIRLNEADRSDIHELLSQSAALAQTNPLAMALCHLYWARYYALEGRLNDAHAALAQWDAMESSIEHGYVRDLADRVKQEISACDGRLVIDRDLFYQENGLEKADKAYKRWLITRLFEKFPSGPTPDQCKSTIGIGKAQLKNWMAFVEFNPWRDQSSRDPESPLLAGEPAESE
jgi:hypothetical protein